MTGAVVDECAGPGGWDDAARSLGLDPLGVEFDDAACATRAAAGLRTLQADVTAVDLRELLVTLGGVVWGLIFSPPCQAFSMAGKGAGRAALAAYVAAIEAMARGESIDREALDAACGDDRAHVVLEPLRWALELRPEWIALEQVAPVLPLWEAMAAALREHGYRTWTGILSAERYGVPQTRQRAILMASRSRQPVEPPATHARYVPGRVKAKQEESLFDAPEPERIVLAADRGLLPWVSMAVALGWGALARPSVTVAAQKGDGGGAGIDGGSGARRTMARERDGGQWLPDDRVGFPRRVESDGWDPDGEQEAFVGENGVEYRDRDLRSASEPAQSVTEKARSWRRWHYRAGSHENATRRPVDEPAPTVHFGHDTAGDEWTTEDGPRPRQDVPGPDAEVQYRRGGERLDESTPVSAPSPAVTSRFDRWQVVDAERRSHYDSRGQEADAEASWVVRAMRCAERAGRSSSQRESAGQLARELAAALSAVPRGQAPAKAVRVTENEAAILQGFPPDYPWQGTRTARYRQIGDAIPPPLARAILEGLIG